MSGGIRIQGMVSQEQVPMRVGMDEDAPHINHCRLYFINYENIDGNYDGSNCFVKNGICSRGVNITFSSGRLNKFCLKG